MIVHFSKRGGPLHLELRCTYDLDNNRFIRQSEAKQIRQLLEASKPADNSAPAASDSVFVYNVTTDEAGLSRVLEFTRQSFAETPALSLLVKKLEELCYRACETEAGCCSHIDMKDKHQVQ